MKKIVSLVLVVVICMSLCACGAETPEDISGTYLYVARVGDGYPIWLHPDLTYDSTRFERGTYIVNRNKIVLQHNNDNSDTTTLVKYGDFYCLEVFEPLQDAYGRTVTFSKDGRANHHISWSNRLLGGTSRRDKKTELIFREDGTFILVEALYVDDQVDYYYEYEGTYTLEDSILTFKSDDIIFYLLYTEKGISRQVYKRYTMDDVKRELMGRWSTNADNVEIVGYTFSEDGTAVQHTPSGDFSYTYELLENGIINCVSSPDGKVIMLQYEWLNDRLRVSEIEEPWTLFVKE